MTSSVCDLRSGLCIDVLCTRVVFFTSTLFRFVDAWEVGSCKGGDLAVFEIMDRVDAAVVLDKGRHFACLFELRY